MLFSVSYSQSKDIQNYLNSLWQFKYQKWGRKDPKKYYSKKYSPNFINKLDKAKDKQTAKTVIEEYLREKDFQKCLPDIAHKIETILNRNEAKIIDTLESVYGNKFPFKKIKVFVTTAPLFPYNYNQHWFMTGKFPDSIWQTNIALHELNHFMFYYYYAKKLKHLSREQFETIKEALAILTNPEGNNKPSVKSLEKFISTNKDKSVDQLIQLITQEKLLVKE